jgi:cell division protein FtsZ
MIKMDETFSSVARIKVIGVGGAGGNAVNRMVKSGFTGVEFIAINTDQLSLDNSLADVKIPIGSKITKGLGAGARPERGFEAIQEDRAIVAAALEGADMVFITAGMGGGTGTGAAPVVAEIAREMGILSVAVVTSPFSFEGPVRQKNCKAGIEALRKNVDTIIGIQNQKLLSIASKQTQVSQAFKQADDVLSNAVRGICDIILQHGNIQVDFADVKTVMENGGDALMGTGVAEGEGRAQAAAERAIRSPLLDDIDVSGASGVLVNISHGEDFGIHELNEVMSYIYEAVGEENQPNIIFGHVENTSPEYVGKVSVTVIAAGFHKVGMDRPTTSIATPVAAPVAVVAAPVAVVAPAQAPQVPTWNSYSVPQEQEFAMAPTIAMAQTQFAPPQFAAPQYAPPQPVVQQYAPAPTMAMPYTAPQQVVTQELPSPFVMPFIGEQQRDPSMDLRRSAYEEVELRPAAPAPVQAPAPIAVAPRPIDQVRVDSLWEAPRVAQNQNHDSGAHRKVESRSTGTVSVGKFYQEQNPMDDDQDRDVPAFLRNQF